MTRAKADEWNNALCTAKRNVDRVDRSEERTISATW
jgi:hypothetical protein